MDDEGALLVALKNIKLDIWFAASFAGDQQHPFKMISSSLYKLNSTQQ
jgi:hypothetical protein